MQYKEDESLTYEDYMRIIKAKSGHWDKTHKDELKLLQPYFDKGYLETNRTGDIWLTEKVLLHLKRLAVIHLIQETSLLTILTCLIVCEMMMQDDVKREFFRKMGWCECTYCAELFYDYDDYVEHDCGLQGVYPDGWEFNWTLSKGD